MNTNNLKAYAPQARREFLSAVMSRINELGVYSDTQIAQGFVEGDLYVIEGKTFERAIQPQRERLVKKVKQVGFLNLIEQVAFTWFNRFCAIRYMELHDYLDHGFHVLSHPSNPKGFEIIEHAQDAADELGLDRKYIIELKLDSNNEELLYKELLLAQCHQLHIAMPFLFEALGDETELLLPSNLLRTDSVIRGLIDKIPTEEWKDVEVIGWLYQFYISEKKDSVMGKVVKSEDIPAATQLFTPNWIVQYLVQNSIGRQWLQTYPDSDIKAKSVMPYYIEPAEQTAEVDAQLAKITPDSLEPEQIKVIDPACGSGHILVEAYNTLKAIYDERGYRARDIPKLILENNIFGLDIDDRAAQLTIFSLMMKAREDDKRIFSRGIKLNVLSLQETAHINLPGLWQSLDLNNEQKTGFEQDLFAEQSIETDDANYKLLQLCIGWFVQAKTLGSLIDVPARYQADLKALLDQLNELAEFGNTTQKPSAEQLLPYVQQAWILSLRYDAVIANPPYMGSKGMNGDLKEFAKNYYPNSKSDLFAIFMERAFKLLNEAGYNAQVNMQSWMFLSSYEALREWLLGTKTFVTMAHLGARAFEQISGEVVQTTAWVLKKSHVDSYLPVFFRLTEGNEKDKKEALLSRKNKFNKSKQSDFKKVPGSPICYDILKSVVSTFSYKKCKNFANSEGKNITSDNERFLRHVWEISSEQLGKNKKWLLYAKGGEYRKWYGNLDHVIDWSIEGRSYYKSHSSGRLITEEQWYLEGITWTPVAPKGSGFRLLPEDTTFDSKGLAIFPFKKKHNLALLGILNSQYCKYVLNTINPTLMINLIDVQAIPISQACLNGTEEVEKLVELHQEDWNEIETSCDFMANPLHAFEGDSVQSALNTYLSNWSIKVEQALFLEKKLNARISQSYELKDHELSAVTASDITLRKNADWVYPNRNNSSSLELFRNTICSDYISFSIGCMMGRYSLDREGLVYAKSGNRDFTTLDNQGVYKSFPADDDGIIPLTDIEWFSDDATYRFRDFIKQVWGKENLQENLKFVAESLCLHAIKPKKSESSLETIRRYLSTTFYKDHLKTYKKRPIYWLFSSGKQKAFESLVYLHRYNEGTLARMRTEYVTPLIGQYDARLAQLEQESESGTPSEKNKLKKQMTLLEKKQAELRTFDDKLKHFADMRISLDLDDGVKVNYGKFGDLLADVKAIHGKVVK